MAARVLTIAGTVWPRRREAEFVVTIFLTTAFACGLIIALAHVVNRGFIALIDSVAANLTVFAFLLCLLLAQRTRMARRGEATSARSGGRAGGSVRYRRGAKPLDRRSERLGALLPARELREARCGGREQDDAVRGGP